MPWCTWRGKRTSGAATEIRELEAELTQRVQDKEFLALLFNENKLTLNKAEKRLDQQ